MRILGLSALVLGTSTGVVMAAIPGCQVAFHWEAVRAEKVVARKVHHTSATLARWKIGAAAWSKAHHGRVYAGHAPAQVAMDWKPLTYRCEDIALETDFSEPVLLGEAPPEFAAYAAALQGDQPAWDIAATAGPPSDEDALLAPFAIFGSPIGGAGRIDSPGAPGTGAKSPLGPASVAPVASTPVAAPMRLLPPKHTPQEITLQPTPELTPVIVPTPEPSAMILLGTGVAALGFGGLRRWLSV